MIKKILFILFPFVVFSQNDSIIKGKIAVVTNELQGINVININKNTGTVTDVNGSFSIKSSVNDTLMFSAINLEGKKIIIKKADFKEGVFVKLNPAFQNLDEIVLTEYPNINAVALGIVSPNIKRYTPAERALNAAGDDFKWYSPLLIPLGGMSVDGLLNDISGRKSALKKNVILEKKDILRNKIMDMYERDYFLNNLHIPEIYIDGFLYYIVEDAAFSEAIKNKNNTLASFLLTDLSTQFLLLNEIEISPIKEVEKPKENTNEK